MGKRARFDCRHCSYLLFVPGLCISLAAVGNVLILSAHFSHNGIHIQLAAVVHLHNDRGVLDLGLQLPELLQDHRLLQKNRWSGSNYGKKKACGKGS